MTPGARVLTISSDSGKYEVRIDRDSLMTVGERLRKQFGLVRLAMITDDRVNGLYGVAVQGSLERAGFDVCRFVFPAGEASKTLATVENAVNFLAANRLTRSDVVVALGGGVVGDLSGFAAAIYLRGVRFVQLPTTLLAAVDSSVGGKTGVDLESGKNLVGAFWQPSAVFCDPAVFETLEPELFADGMAEIIKHGFIADESYLRMLETADWKESIEAIVARSVEIKAEFVAADTRDKGVRQMLNFGHTFGHAIEQRSQYTIRHGAAVAIGMVMASRVADRLGFAEESITARLERLLVRAGLPTVSPFSAEELADVALNDKKRVGQKISFVMPVRDGEVRLETVDVERIPEFFRLGCERD